MAVSASEKGWRSVGSLLLGSLVVVLSGVKAGTGDIGTVALGDAIWREASPVSIAVEQGKARFQVPVPAECVGRGLLVIVSCLSRAAGPFAIRLDAKMSSTASAPKPAASEPVRAPTLKFAAPSISKPFSTRMPAAERTFHMMVREGDVSSPSNYLAVRGELRAVGRRVQVYVAAEDSPAVGKDLLNDVVTKFDDRIFPVSERQFGPVTDVDGDGRFTVLISSWLSRLGNGRHAVDGYVRVTDLDTDYSPPFGNRCDMMYLSTSLKPGPHLGTVMAHEYTHAVIFSRKSLEGPTPPFGPFEEEGWLDEALAHLAEDLHGFSRSNLDYRISAYLSQPERYRLVVDDYYAADLFRSHGNRGSTYLFLRWCADQFGPELLPAMVRSKLRGISNLEAATGRTFSELFRRWTIALYLSGLEPEPQDTGDRFHTLNVRGPLENYELAGPRTTRVVTGGQPDCWDAAGTSPHYVLVEATGAGAIDLAVEGPAEADLQVTALLLPSGMAGLDLSARSVCGPDGDMQLRLSVQERKGTPVRLTGLAWEPLSPPPNPHVPGQAHGHLDMLGIVDHLGTSALPARGRLLSRPIRLIEAREESGPLVVKVIGTDAKGHRVAAWTQVKADTGHTVQEEPPIADGGE